MKQYATDQIRNIGVVAHGGAGKTSLVETMLYNTGVLSRMGKVEDGTTTSDYHPEEINRKITIHTSLVPCEWKEKKLNLLDTPGFSDFIGEVKSSLRVVESALFVVSAVDGVQVQTEVIWDLADEAKLPRAVFINKMDRENADFKKTYGELEDSFQANFVPLVIPAGSAESFNGLVNVIEQKAYTFDDNGNSSETEIPGDLKADVEKYREKVLEAAAESDDDLLMKYLEGEELTEDEINKGLKKVFKNGKAVPVLCGSAIKNIGVTEIMNVMAEYFPAPEKTEDKLLAALVFKTIADPYVGRMNFIRIFNGTLKSDSTVYNANKEKTEKIGQIFYLRGKKQTQVNEVPTGDIAVLVKLQDTATGDTLCTKENPVKLEGIDFPEPTLTVAITPKSKGDEDKLSNSIGKLLEEDPTIKMEKNTETKETLLTGMGEMHLEITMEKLKKRYGVDVEINTPKVPYRETIRSEVKVEGKYKKQTGGHGQYGHVWLRLEPLPDKHFDFDEEIFGGAVPKQYIPAVEKGVKEAMEEGVLARYPVTGVKTVLYDGSYHTVDSSEMAFKIATIQAFRKGCEQANPVLLEPIMEVEVTIPESFMGDIISDLNTKRGRVLGMEPHGKTTTVKAMVPLAEMYRYAIDLKSMTQGRGSFKMKFSNYEEVPAQLAEKIIEKAKQEKESK